MQYVKSQIFKLEFANHFEFESIRDSTSGYLRKGIHTCTVLDSIINYYMEMYIEMNKEFRRCNKEMYLCNVDCEVEDTDYIYRNGNTVLHNYHGIYFDYWLNLPFSVDRNK